MKIGQDILWLSEADVASLLTMKETLQVVEGAFALHDRVVSSLSLLSLCV
jgi:ornithine cyclodeaminase/alanine dehydrogenase-like protein (mu-crystallin family)